MPEHLPHWSRTVAEAHRAKLLGLEVRTFEEERRRVLKSVRAILRVYPREPLPLSPDLVAARQAADLPDGISVELDEPVRRSPREVHDRMLFQRRNFEHFHAGLIRSARIKGKRGTKTSGSGAFAAGLLVRLRMADLPVPSALVFGLLAQATGVEDLPEDVDQKRRRWEQTLSRARKLAAQVWEQAPKKPGTDIPTSAEEMEARIYARTI
jgi:hypothetical protein